MTLLWPNQPFALVRVSYLQESIAWWQGVELFGLFSLL